MRTYNLFAAFIAILLMIGSAPAFAGSKGSVPRVSAKPFSTTTVKVVPSIKATPAPQVAVPAPAPTKPIISAPATTAAPQSSSQSNLAWDYLDCNYGLKSLAWMMHTKCWFLHQSKPKKAESECEKTFPNKSSDAYRECLVAAAERRR